jgi:hypothetical protein
MMNRPSDYLLSLADKICIDPSLPETIRMELAAEHGLNGGTRTYSRHSGDISGLSTRYRAPQALAAPANNGLLLRHSPEHIVSIGEQSPGLLIHPQVYGSGDRFHLPSRLIKQGEMLPFYPLASLRSVLIRVDGVWRRAKLHFDQVKISRYFRNLGGRTIEHSVAVSRELKCRQNAIQDSYDDDEKAVPKIELDFLLDRSGSIFAPGRDPELPIDDSRRDGEWGCLWRQDSGRTDSPQLLIPLFSFYGTAGSEAEEPAERLLDFIISKSGMKIDDFIFTRLMAPIIRAWVAVFRQTGIIWEPHGQNIVFALDSSDLMPCRILLRDADTAVSSARRTELGLPSDRFYARNVHDHSGSTEMPAGDRSEISRVIDISMGINCFEYLARLSETRITGSGAVLADRCRSLFQEIWPEHNQWLTRWVYSYAPSPLPQDRNCYPLIMRPDLAPKWRPAGLS